MSRVYFHSQHGEAELRGSERAHCGLLVDHLTDGFLSSIYGEDVQRLLGLVRPDHYLHKQAWQSTAARSTTRARGRSPGPRRLAIMTCGAATGSATEGCCATARS